MLILLGLSLIINLIIILFYVYLMHYYGVIGYPSFRWLLATLFLSFFRYAHKLIFYEDMMVINGFNNTFGELMNFFVLFFFLMHGISSSRNLREHLHPKDNGSLAELKELFRKAFSSEIKK